MRTEVVYLPHGQVLVGAGNTEGQSGGEPDRVGVVKRCDLLDPRNGSWRRVANMLEFREYHAVTLLIPDGRVITTGGTAIAFEYPPQNNWVEAYSPPYLFRGVRPTLSNFSSTRPTRGETVTFNIGPESRLTSVVLMGVQSTTHWVDAGIPRRLELTVTQQGSVGSVVLPTDSNLLPLGWYMLFGMVDDIPSQAQIIQVAG
jgi:hypothetical protein